MDIQQLKYVVYAVRLESHTRAAEALYVQPQTISKAVSNTETRCGRKLFVREGRNVRPAPTQLSRIWSSRPSTSPFLPTRFPLPSLPPHIAATFVLPMRYRLSSSGPPMFR